MLNNRIEKCKKYIKDFKNVEQLYFNGLNEKTLQQKFEYIKNHFTYYTMNSWNGLQSIANNVKLYNLKLDNEVYNKFYELIEVDEDFMYWTTNGDIQNFEAISDTDIGFNGRSGGYLVMYKTNSNDTILSECYLKDIYDYDTYKEMKQENETYRGEIEEMYYLIKAFDKFCDLLREDLIYAVKNSNIVEEEVTETKLVKSVVFGE